MKKNKIIMMLSLALLLLQAEAQSLEIVSPVNKGLEKTKVYSGKTVSYYPLSKRKAVEVELKGADEINIFTRLRLNRESLNSYFTIAYSFDDNKELFKKSLSIGKSARGIAYFDRTIDEKPSVLRKVKVKVPKGAKILKVYVSKDGGHKVDATFSSLKKLNGKNAKAKKIKPIVMPNDSINLLIGKRRTFYKLRSKSPTKIQVKGPGELYVFSRTRYERDEKGKRTYTLKYKRNGKLIKSKTYKYTTPSEGALYADKKMDLIPSKLKRLVIKIPPGNHDLEFTSSKAEEDVDAYFRFKKKLKPVWKPLSLYEEKETSKLKVIGKDQLRSYARINDNESVKVRISGPTKIRVYVRAEFEYHMHSNNDIRVLAYQDTSLLNTFIVSSKRTKTLEYNNRDDLVPGTLNKIYIDVPAGEHEYTFKLKDKSKSALIRIAYDESLRKLKNPRA